MRLASTGPELVSVGMCDTGGAVVVAVSKAGVAAVVTATVIY
jgi:hypothetical protein